MLLNNVGVNFIGIQNIFIKMDEKTKACLSNIAFSTCSMSIFLLCRHKIFVSNAFRNSISSLCMNILHYQTRNNITHFSSYLKRLSAYLAIQSILLYSLPNTNYTYQDYKINTIKVVSPILFCTIFKLPIAVGVGLGIAANDISANRISELKQYL